MREKREVHGEGGEKADQRMSDKEAGEGGYLIFHCWDFARKLGGKERRNSIKIQNWIFQPWRNKGAPGKLK